MKLLVVLVSALVLVAHCTVIPEDDGAYLADHEPEEYEAYVVNVDTAEDVGETTDIESVDMPVLARACTNAVCVRLCNRLGFKRGVCISSTVCKCTK